MMEEQRRQMEDYFRQIYRFLRPRIMLQLTELADIDDPTEYDNEDKGDS
jgi:hypothetical protein